MTSRARMEHERDRQRRIVEDVLSHSSKDEHVQSYTSPQPLTHCEPSSPTREEKKVDLRSLFSGQQFSFLEGEKEGLEEPAESDSGSRTTTSQAEPCVNSVSVEAQQRETQSLFFFHWSNPELSNRHDHSFHTSRAREELERGWPEKRSAMKQLIRHSHRHAVRTAGQRKRTHKTLT